MAKITVSSDCTGCGICVDIAPTVFKIGDDGLSHVIGTDAAKAKEAADSCPVTAITVA